MENILILFITLFFVGPFSFAASKKTYKVDKFNVSLTPPQGWQDLRGYLGRDITLLGPELGAKRDTVFIEVTEAKRINFSEEKKAQNKFKDIKLEWLEKKAGKLISFNLSKELPFLKNEYLYHEVSYILNKKRFVEGNLFMKCSKDVGLTISFLTLKDKFTPFQKNFKSILKSVSCSS